MKTEIKRVTGIPFTYRIQNFMFDDQNELIWFSGSHSLWQKLKGFITKKGTHFANVSTDITIPSHGQEIQPFGFDAIEVRGKGIYDVYSGDLTDFTSGEGFKCYNPSAIRGKVPHVLLQGAELYGGVINSVHGNSSEEDISVLTHSRDYTLLKEYTFKFKTYSKWYWDHWEAEGIRTDNFGKLWFGVDVKTKFGFHLTYLIAVEKN